MEHTFTQGIGLNLAKELEKAIADHKYHKPFFPELVFLGMYISTLLSTPERGNSDTNYNHYMSLHEKFNRNFQGDDFDAVVNMEKSAYSDYSNLIDSYLIFDIIESIYPRIAEILIERIKKAFGQDISNRKQDLSARIEFSVQIAKEAYSEHRKSEKIFISSAFKNRELSRIFENGDITATEFIGNIDYKTDPSNENLTKSKITTIILVFLMGLISGFIICKNYPYYSSAEECAILTQHKDAAWACYDLYPSARDSAK